jgi:TetR/AcrR family transcriptional regulator, cholesterol catabolism regulator
MAKRGPREKSEHYEQRRIEIIDEAARLFSEKGYANTGVAELCDTVGLGKGALYYYIGSKEQLLVWIHDRVMDEVLASSAEVLAQGLPPAEQLRALGTRLIDTIVSFPDHVWVFLHEWRALGGENVQHFRARRREYEHVIEQTLRDGVDAGAFRIDDVRVAVLAWLGMHNYVYQWFRQPGRVDPHTLADQFADLFLGGIVADGQMRASARNSAATRSRSGSQARSSDGA